MINVIVMRLGSGALKAFYNVCGGNDKILFHSITMLVCVRHTTKQFNTTVGWVGVAGSGCGPSVDVGVTGGRGYGGPLQKCSVTWMCSVILQAM